MSETVWSGISSPASSVTLRAEQVVESWLPNHAAPIDVFLSELRRVATNAHPDAVTKDPRGASLAIVRIVGAVETYIRSVLSRAACFCPRAEAASDVGQVTLFAARRYSNEFLAAAVLEGSSLADAGEIKKRVKAMLGFEVQIGSSLDVALTEYAKVCNIRHAVAHTSGAFSSRNLLALGVASSTRSPQQLKVTAEAIQEIAAVCETVVRAFNLYTFQRIVEGWIGAGRVSGDWRKDQILFKPVFGLYRSKSDNRPPKTAYGFWRRIAALV